MNPNRWAHDSELFEVALSNHGHLVGKIEMMQCAECRAWVAYDDADGHEQWHDRLTMGLRLLAANGGRG